MSVETPQAEGRPGSRRRPARRGQGSQLREEIVEAAGREIARTGDAGGLTLRGVAREVGVAATSIYLHFESVTELVDEVKRCRFGDLQAQLRAAADAAGDDPWRASGPGLGRICGMALSIPATTRSCSPPSS